jgi:hypothetical protein
MKRGKPFESIDPIIRFHSKYEIDPETNCWNWIGTISQNYGKISIGRKLIGAHRFSYELHYGEIKNNLLVCHNCNNPICVNPDHLRLDNQSGNFIDKSYAMTHWKQKLSVEEVIEIKIALKNPYRGLVTELSKKYGVKSNSISEIKNGNNWSHIKV